MSDKKDWHEEGQKRQAESRSSSIVDDIMDEFLGRGRYDPPSNPDDEKKFYKGIRNAQNNPPHK